MRGCVMTVSISSRITVKSTAGWLDTYDRFPNGIKENSRNSKTGQPFRNNGGGMQSKHLIIAGIWIFAISIVIGFFVTGVNVEFFGYLMLLFIAFIFSLITEVLLTKK